MNTTAQNDLFGCYPAFWVYLNDHVNLVLSIRIRFTSSSEDSNRAFASSIGVTPASVFEWIRSRMTACLITQRCLFVCVYTRELDIHLHVKQRPLALGAQRKGYAHKHGRAISEELPARLASRPLGHTRAENRHQRGRMICLFDWHSCWRGGLRCRC
jgi:hypothetical protein